VKYIHYGDIHTLGKSVLDCENDDIPRIREHRLPNVPFLEDGDLIMVDASEDYEGIGTSVEVKNATGRRVVAGLHTLLLRGDKTLFADGFKGYIQFIPSFKNQLIEIATGTSVYGVSKSKIQQLTISLPSLPEQRAIAEVLSARDAEITALEARRDKTHALKQGLMSELLTGRIRLTCQA
jgi:type I restriction enzyme S subunit